MKPLIPVFFGTLVFLGLIYYLLPAPFLLAGGPAWFLLLVINPLACLITGIVFGLICGLKKSAILHPFIAGIAFIPTLYLYYNDSALVYLAFYVITAVMGVGIGWIIYLKK
ncbi:MAG: hypothetical protein Q7J08_08735 [Methanocorpusculum sp.]|uniref:hypothetical protein n=1 Tax=Methanocorpusculum sp. TaxID=2058474 RepID=UPI002723A409|nr:hypothetical protein [Methanocorpusculum sp.]MDO9523777.1 hypothetical protein [Methanocorpusculum sp.]